MTNTYDSANDQIVITDPGADGTTKLKMRARVTAANGDWAARIAEPNVVWYHNFDLAAEVNQFRWTNAWGGGNDPNGNGVGAALVSHQPTGGADGGGFMRLSYLSGGGGGSGNSYWWRPFAPFSSGNGRGAADPGAGVTLQAWSPTNGGSQTNTFAAGANPSWYGHSTNVAANPTKYQGTDFYMQIRVRRTSTPGRPPDSGSFTNITGKSIWHTTTNATVCPQELVTFGYSNYNPDSVGVQSWHNVYVGQNFDSIGGSQPNATETIVNSSVLWRYSGGWDTLLYHITPGTNAGTGSGRTRVEVWAQHSLTLFPAEVGQYTKIWDVTYSQSYDTSHASDVPGWSALILACYHNGSPFGPFDFDYDQLIFSKATIAAPTV